MPCQLAYHPHIYVSYTGSTTKPTRIARKKMTKIKEIKEMKWWSDEATGILQGNCTNENVNFVYFHFGVLCSSLYSDDGRQRCTQSHSFLTSTCTVGRDWQKKQVEQRFFDWVMTFLLKAMSWPTLMRVLVAKPVFVECPWIHHNIMDFMME